MTPRLLAVRLGSLGDIVHALPAVATLRASFPDARIDWLVEQRWLELIELHPDLSNAIPAPCAGPHLYLAEPDRSDQESAARRLRRGD